jgi:two-component sensor histidine kinase
MCIINLMEPASVRRWLMAVALLLALLLVNAAPAWAQGGAVSHLDSSASAAKRLLIRADTLLYTQPDTTLALARRAEALARAAHNPADQGAAWNTIGAVYYTRDAYRPALRAYQQAVRCLEAAHDPQQQAAVLGNLGALCLTMNLPEAGYGYFEQNLRLLLKLRPDSAGTGVALMGTGMALMKLNRLPEALVRFRICQRRARRAGVASGEAKALAYIAQVYLRQQQFAEALRTLQAARALVPSLSDDPVFEVDMLRNFGDAYRGLGQWERAAASYEAMLRQATNQIDQQAALYALAEVQERTGDFRGATRSLRRVQALNDSLSDHQTAQQVQELETRYRTRAQRQQIEVQQLTIGRKNQLVAFGFGTAALVLLAAGGLGWQARRLSRANAVVRRTVTQKEALMQEVHHRVKNNLQLVSSLLGWQADANPALAQALAESRDRIQAMALIHEHLYRADDISRIHLDAYLGQLLNTLQAAYAGTGPRVTLTADLAPLAVPADVAIPLGLVVNELVTNAYKHAFRGRAAGHLRVVLAAPAGSFEGAPAAAHFRLRVEDDGVGLPPDRGATRPGALGVELVALMADQLNAHFSNGPAVGGGTWFEISSKELRVSRDL